MCGIYAQWRSATANANANANATTTTTQAMRERAVAATRKLRHRGPDSAGITVAGNGVAVLGHERLAIVDVSAAAQPFVFVDPTAADPTRNRVILAVNGEIYNHEDLRERLELMFPGSPPYPYASASSDCEVILPLYLAAAAAAAPASALDVSFIDALCGQFAFVLFDERTNVFVASRDHLGIVPLYIGHGYDDGESVYFASEMKALRECVCGDIATLPPGVAYVGVGGGGGATFARWYFPAWQIPEALAPTARVNVSLVRELLEASVERCMMSDVPWGVLLSGGLDSSLIAAIAAHAATRPLHSFTISLADAADAPPSPDAAAAARVAAFLGTTHHDFTFTLQEGLDALNEVVYHVETYDVTSIRSSVPMYLLSRRVKALGVKMVLTGEGSDEIFGGYLYFHHAPSREEFHAETVDKVKALHLYDCNRANKATAAWGVEARVPFLDKAFVAYCMSVDPVFKMVDMEFGFMEKFMLRTAFSSSTTSSSSPWLPADVLWRQKEQFSDGVGYAWIDGLRAFAETQVSDSDMSNAARHFPFNTPVTKEAYLYRKLFEAHFPPGAGFETTVPPNPFSVACSTARAASWLASSSSSGVVANDPSGRAVGLLRVHRAAAAATSVESSNLVDCRC